MKTAAPVLLGLAVFSTALFAEARAAADEPEKPAATAQPQPPATASRATGSGAFRHAEEVTVESASRVETTLVDAPATMSVVTSEALASSPAQNYGDLLRSVPGMNVIQTSARDFNLTTRQGTSTLNNSQLVLVDGRSVYLDFFGLVLWDFLPSPTSGEIKQIEVVRGPASVVWGANALSGVVNVITRAPRESPGLALTLRAGLFGRDGGSREDQGQGSQYGGGFSYAGTAGPAWSYRLSAGYFSSDPYSRPVGQVPLSCHPLGANPCRDAGRERASRRHSGRWGPLSERKRWPRQLRQQRHQPAQAGPAHRPGSGRRGRLTLSGGLRRDRGHHPHRNRAVRRSRAARTWPTAGRSTTGARCGSGRSPTSSMPMPRTCCRPTP